MKKFSLFLIALICSFTFLLTGCSKKDSNVIRVNEVTHSIFYAPLYIAINNGYFEEEGLKIELTNGGGADKSMMALTSNSADIALMGAEATVYVVKQGKKDAPKVFAQLTKRDGSFIVGRENIENFTVADMEGKEILGGRKGGMPAMILEYMLYKNGLIKGENITINYDVEFNNMTSAFIGGTADFTTAFEPSASAVADASRGYILASVGQLSGEVPYTCFTANESYLTKNADKVNKFLKAVMKGYHFLMTADIDKVVDALSPSFEGTTKESIKKSITAYIKADSWVENPAMKEEVYNNLMDVMKYAKELTDTIPFTSVVDNTYALKAYQEFKAV